MDVCPPLPPPQRIPFGTPLHNLILQFIGCSLYRKALFEVVVGPRSPYPYPLPRYDCSNCLDVTKVVLVLERSGSPTPDHFHQCAPSPSPETATLVTELLDKFRTACWTGEQCRTIQRRAHPYSTGGIAGRGSLLQLHLQLLNSTYWLRTSDLALAVCLAHGLAHVSDKHNTFHLLVPLAHIADRPTHWLCPCQPLCTGHRPHRNKSTHACCAQSHTHVLHTCLKIRR